jgi:hypothetical protein
VILPRQRSAPSAAAAPQAPRMPGAVTPPPAQPRHAASPAQLQHLSAASKRRHRLLPLLLIVVTVCAAAAAVAFYRSNANSPADTDARPAAANPSQPAAALGASDAERQAIVNFLATSGNLTDSHAVSIARTGTDTYPNGSLSKWSVDGLYTFWLGSDLGQDPLVVRMQQDPPSPGATTSSSPAADYTAASLNATIRDVAKVVPRLSSSFGTPYYRRVPRARVTSSNGTDAYVYTWQSVAETGDGTQVLLPKWVTAWVDPASGVVVGLDSLDGLDSQSENIQAQLNEVGAGYRASGVAAWQDAGRNADAYTATLMLVPVRRGAEWGGSRLVWKVQLHGGAPVYILDAKGPARRKDPADLYLPVFPPDELDAPDFDGAR